MLCFCCPLTSLDAVKGYQLPAKAETECSKYCLLVKTRNTNFSLTPQIFGSIVYNRAIVYRRQNFLKVAVHVIIIDYQ